MKREFRLNKDALIGVPLSESRKAVRVRPGTWVIPKETDSRTPKEIKEAFREKFSGCSYGCHNRSAFHSYGLEEANNIASGARAFIQANFINPMLIHYERIEKLIKRIEYIGHRYEIPIGEYLSNICEITDAGIFDRMSTMALIKDIREFNEKFKD